MLTMYRDRPLIQHLIIQNQKTEKRRNRESGRSGISISSLTSASTSKMYDLPMTDERTEPKEPWVDPNI